MVSEVYYCHCFSLSLNDVSGGIGAVVVIVDSRIVTLQGFGVNTAILSHAPEEAPWNRPGSC